MLEDVGTYECAAIGGDYNPQYSYQGTTQANETAAADFERDKAEWHSNMVKRIRLEREFYERHLYGTFFTGNVEFQSVKSFLVKKAYSEAERLGVSLDADQVESISSEYAKRYLRGEYE